MQSRIEEQREGHSKYSHLNAELVTSLASAPAVAVSTHRERLDHAHRSSHLLNKVTDTAKDLSLSYDDHVSRVNEIEALAGSGVKGNEVTEFYTRLAHLKDWHRRHPQPPISASSQLDHGQDWAELEGAGVTDGKDYLDRLFSGEEALGRYYDLNTLHTMFTNLPGAQRQLPYLSFLDQFDQFDAIAKQRKMHGEKYKQYLDALFAYLMDFAKRAFPLADVKLLVDNARREFADLWENNNVPHWKQEAAENGNSSEGIWCAACQKMYSKQTVYNAHLTSKKHLKASANTGDSTPQPSSSAVTVTGKEKERNREKHLALQEHLITTLLTSPSSPLLPIRGETKSNVERRASLTDRERAQELEDLERREAEEAAEAAAGGGKEKKKDEFVDEREEEEKLYNPLKLPLGWDGKPIPYWLYKLHGLGVEYSCEICSGRSYNGRKNFERHFQEANHTFGMKALGLPNTKHFHEITKIEDAIALAERLKAEGKQEIFRAEEMEELEDEEGNVYNRKVYNDLKTQGLL